MPTASGRNLNCLEYFPAGVVVVDSLAEIGPRFVPRCNVCRWTSSDSPGVCLNARCNRESWRRGLQRRYYRFMPRAPRLVGLVVATACVAGIASAPAIACSPKGCTETSTGTVPADGSMVTQTDQVPAGATQGSFKLEPLPGTDPQAFDEVTDVLVESFPWLAKTSKRNKARLACALMSYLPIANQPADQPITYENVERQLMLLTICLRMAQSIPAQSAARPQARSSAGGCGRFDAQVQVSVTHSRSGYRGVVTSKIKRASRSGLRVSCRRSGNGLLLKVRPRKPGQKLRAAAGPTLAIAYANPTSKPVGIKTTFKVK